MARPQRKIKPTAKAKLASVTSDGDDKDDLLVIDNTEYGNAVKSDTKRTKETQKKTRKAEGNTKGASREKRARSYGSEDELATTDDGDSDSMDKVEFLTTDPKSPFVHMDLIVTLSYFSKRTCNSAVNLILTYTGRVFEAGLPNLFYRRRQESSRGPASRPHKSHFGRPTPGRLSPLQSRLPLCHTPVANGPSRRSLRSYLVG